MDIISRLEGISHVLEEIFLHLDSATLFESVKVSTTWKRLITSLDVFVWKNNVRMLPTWRTLSTRMEHSQPQLRDRMKKGDATSYRAACRYVEDNIRQISQSATKNLNFETLLRAEYTDSVVRMSDRYVFISWENNFVIFNRWTQIPVKEFFYPETILDIQFNERFVVVQLGCYEIAVYDAQTLEYIQTPETNSAIEYQMTFGLGSDVIFIRKPSKKSKYFKFDVHRWNPQTARFVRDTETEERLKVTFVKCCYMHIYVDDKYLIVDFDITANNSRLIKVFSLETLQRVRKRKFLYDFHNIRREYHDG